MKTQNEHKKYLQDLFAKKDKDGNTVLHIAAQEPITDQKLKMISDMLEKGAIPSETNKKGETFLKMSLGMPQRLCAHINKMDDNWFKHLISNREVLQSFIALKDDDIFSTMLKRFSAIAEDETDKAKQVHPITLLDYIWEDKKVLDDSFHELMIWEAKYHDKNLDELKACCHDNLEPEKSFEIYNNMEQKVEEPFGIAYCMRRAFKSFITIFFIMKIIDFATDVTLNIEYYVDEFKDFPSKSECDAMTSPSITCYFHQMNGKTLFSTSLSIFVLTFCFDLLFVMSDKKSNHYLATLVGFCCWKNFKDHTTPFQKTLYWFCWIPLFIFNQIFTPLYGFFMESFVEYWLPTPKQRPAGKARKAPCSKCHLCIGCKKSKVHYL